MTPKRILIFSLAYHPLVGGAEIAVKEITDRIAPSEFSFDMLTLRFHAQDKRYEKIGNVGVYRIGFPALSAPLNKRFFPFMAFIAARRLHVSNTYDAIWAIMANYAGFGAVFFKMTHSRIPFLLTLQEGDPIDYIKKRVRFVYPLFVRIFTKADFIQAISRYLGNFARDMGFTGPLTVVPNGVDAKHFSQTYPSEVLRELAVRLHKKENDVFLITASRLVTKNAVGDIIAALQFLPKHMKLLITGTGPLERELKLPVTSYQLQDRVLFLGHINHAELPKYLQISDVFVRPSLSEGMGNSFVEAMAAGIPIIATPVGGIVDFLKDGETGLFCEVKNPKSIAEKVLFLQEHTDARSTMVANARKMVTEKYDWNIVTKDMKDIFKTVCVS
ncbi:MAG: glycosyltransferase family 4 protein [Patescibacteria group bacterium]